MMFRIRETGSCVIAIVVVGMVLGGLGTGCKRANAPVNGLGGFELGKTTVVDAQAAARCFDTGEFIRCMVTNGQSIAGLPTQIQLDFSGNTTDATLVEIAVEIAGCKHAQVTEWLADRMGKPDETGNDHSYWIQQYIFLALWENGPSRCAANAVKPNDSERISRIRSALSGMNR